MIELFGGPLDGEIIETDEETCNVDMLVLEDIDKCQNARCSDSHGVLTKSTYVRNLKTGKFEHIASHSQNVML